MIPLTVFLSGGLMKAIIRVQSCFAESFLFCLFFNFSLQWAVIHATAILKGNKPAGWRFKRVRN